MAHSYGIVDEEGTFRRQLSALPINDLDKGLRLTYLNTCLYTGKMSGAVIRLKEGDTEGVAFLLPQMALGTYEMYVVGTDPKSVQAIVEKLEIMLGARKQGRPYALPQLPGMFQRFLVFVDYIVKGVQP